jgi:hypothetical protein
MKRIPGLKAFLIGAALLASSSAATSVAQNLVPNPTFDTQIAPWINNDTDHLTVTWSSSDADGSASSGSALMVQSSPLQHFGIQIYTSCLTLPGASAYDFGGKFRIPSGQATEGSGYAGVEWFSDSACSNYITTTFAPAVTDLNSWQPSSLSGVTPPAGSVAAHAELFAQKDQAGGSFSIYADDAFLRPTNPVPCVAAPTTLCIDDQAGDRRFRVEADYQTVQGGGASGHAQAIPLSSLGISHGGVLWFFSADNPELLVKILNACGFAGRFWVFASAGTNVGVTLTITDTLTGAQKVYTNPDLNPMAPIQDTSAFNCS